MKLFWVGLTCLLVGLAAGYLYGRRWGNLEAYRIGYDTGYYTGASDTQLYMQRGAER